MGHKKGSSIFSGETCLKIVAQELMKRHWRIARDIQLGNEKGILDKKGKNYSTYHPGEVCETSPHYRRIGKSGCYRGDVAQSSGKSGNDKIRNRNSDSQWRRKKLTYKAIIGKKVIGTIISV